MVNRRNILRIQSESLRRGIESFCTIAQFSSLFLLIQSDALHVPGYYDSLGAMCASTSLGPLPSLLVGLISGALLISYYEIYLLSFWILGIAGLLYSFLKRKGFSAIGALASPSATFSDGQLSTVWLLGPGKGCFHIW